MNADALRKQYRDAQQRNDDVTAISTLFEMLRESTPTDIQFAIARMDPTAREMVRQDLCALLSQVRRDAGRREHWTDQFARILAAPNAA